MTTTTEPSVDLSAAPAWQKLLYAAHRLEEQGESPFTAEALAVAAWKEFPAAFGLTGYHELYPDSNRALAGVMGERGLVRRGLLSRVGKKLYTLTPDGRSAVFRARPAVLPPRPVRRVPKAQEPALVRMLGSEALAKHSDGRQAELSLADALAFWGILQGDYSLRIELRQAMAQAALELAEEAAARGELLLSDGRSVSAEEVQGLQRAHDYLAARFAHALTLLGKRGAAGGNGKG